MAPDKHLTLNRKTYFYVEAETFLGRGLKWMEKRNWLYKKHVLSY